MMEHITFFLTNFGHILFTFFFRNDQMWTEEVRIDDKSTAYVIFLAITII